MSKKEIDKTLIQYIESKHNQSIYDLFMISLEALQNVCNPQYDAVVKYSEKDSNVVKTGGKKDKVILPQLRDKFTDLMNFASQKKIKQNDIKLVCKGKWYLYNYAYFALETIQGLAEDCKNNKIHQCEACNMDKYQNCHYKSRLNYKTEQLIEQIKDFVDLGECSDIINFLKTMN